MRDGVGDSQKKMIVTQEIPQFLKAIHSRTQTANIKIVFLMVNKRIKTKLILHENG
jgi:hypothetical protein